MGHQAESPPGTEAVEVHSGAAFLNGWSDLTAEVGNDGQPRNRLESAAAAAAEFGWYRGSDFRPVPGWEFFYFQGGSLRVWSEEHE